MSDFDLYVDASIALLTPLTAAAREWLTEAVGPDVFWHGSSLPVELRYLDDLLEGISEAGWEVDS